MREHSVSGDEKNSDESSIPKDGQDPIKPVLKSVFSDDFDDPDNRRDLDELPEDEPLTPELVEEEAIRGDFMLRWATVCLAVLMAFGQLNDTRPLVLIRSGDQMRANGFMPARVDHFSHTMEGKPITNVSWLFDHLVSLAWLGGGETGLTVLKVLLTAVSVWLLVRISVPGVSTWWSSICSVFAIVAASSDFWPLPELITILGMTLTMRFLFQHRQGQSSGLEWKLPLLIILWCNFDSRAWIGVFVVMLYAFGNALTRRALIRGDAPADRIPRSLTGVAIASVMALAVNPFPLSSLLSPITVYSVEYPAMQAQKPLVSSNSAITFDNRVDYYKIINPEAATLFDHSQVAGIAILLIALFVVLLSMGSEQSGSARYGASAIGTPRLLRFLHGVTVLINGRPSRETGFLFALLGMIFLVVLAAHELPAAAIVACVVASVSAQEWYRRSFSMKYTTEARELLFSRGGRAATVLGLAAIGFLVVTSRLPGVTPLGFGFDQDTRTTIDTVGSQLKDLAPDARILHTRIEQGDILIWNDRKSFVDSRVIPFGRPGSPNSVFGKHVNILKSLMRPPQPAPATSDPKKKEEFENTQKANAEAALEAVNEFKVTHAMIRLAPPGEPDYPSLETLATSRGWFLVSLGASAAIVERATPETTLADVEAKRPPFEKMAFQTAKINPPGLRQFAAPPTFYEKYVYRSRPFTNADKRMAGHHLYISGGQPESFQRILSSLSSTTLAIRHLNTCLAETPDDSEAREMLGECYLRLGMFEEIIAGQNVGGRLKQLRYLQTVISFRQALAIDAKSIRAWNGLVIAYQQLSRFDLASEALGHWLELAEENPVRGTQFEEELTQRYALQRQYRDQLRDMDERFTDAVETQRQQQLERDKQSASAGGKAEAKVDDMGKEASEIVMQAQMANVSGLPRKALQLLQEKSTLVRSIPYGTQLYGTLLLEAGDLEEAHSVLADMKLAANSQPDLFESSEWQLPVAISELAICDYGSASATWNAQLAWATKQVSNSELYLGALFSLPLAADVNFGVNGVVPVWPIHHSLSVGEAATNTTDVRAEITLLLALSRLEEGDLKGAKTLFQSVLADFGDTTSRSVATVYYSMMDDEAQAFIEANSVSASEEYLFPGEKLPDPETAARSRQTTAPATSESPEP